MEMEMEMSLTMKFLQNYSSKRNFIIYYFLVKRKPHQRIDLLITTSVNFYQTKNPVVMKTCFSEGKLQRLDNQIQF